MEIVEAKKRPLRLGVGHILLWMSCVAVHLTVNRAISQLFVASREPLDASNSSGVTVRFAVLMMFLEVVYAAAFAGTIAIIFHWVRVRALTPAHPGYWILMMSAGSQLLVWVVNWMTAQLSYESHAFMYACLFLTSNVMALSYGTVSLATRGHILWRTFFGVASLTFFVASLGYGMAAAKIGVAIGFLALILEVVPILLWLLASGLLVCAVFQDFRNNIPRDVFHFVGVALFLLGFAVILLRIIALLASL